MLNVAIVDQGEFNDEEHESKCYDKLNPDEQVVVVREIVEYTITVIRGFVPIVMIAIIRWKPTHRRCYMACGYDVLTPH
ncbi:hypothetical protein H257_19179 [Aphanomyces astaci]|uniref:Uncharacterized protein n=1 Tax=Aphanomyces astaci TaxID=112090 RepID=W4FAY5_APHAT|nr:hypothetical protein H257_19179 [Aphanomyces astaci]ETV63888.1 hypothetical protein H257_19179 [Aphanomyces astaci]|eukprot:XP_009846626.1 hypothetical protein H257_19179 [Aphanomyces astaci]